MSQLRLGLLFFIFLTAIAISEGSTKISISQVVRPAQFKIGKFVVHLLQITHTGLIICVDPQNQTCRTYHLDTNGTHQSQTMPFSESKHYFSILDDLWAHPRKLPLEINTTRPIFDYLWDVARTNDAKYEPLGENCYKFIDKFIRDLGGDLSLPEHPVARAVDLDAFSGDTFILIHGADESKVYWKLTEIDASNFQGHVLFWINPEQNISELFTKIISQLFAKDPTLTYKVFHDNAFDIFKFFNRSLRALHEDPEYTDRIAKYLNSLTNFTNFVNIARFLVSDNADFKSNDDLYEPFLYLSISSSVWMRLLAKIPFFAKFAPKIDTFISIPITSVILSNQSDNSNIIPKLTDIELKVSQFNSLLSTLLFFLTSYIPALLLCFIFIISLIMGLFFPVVVGFWILILILISSPNIWITITLPLICLFAMYVSPSPQNFSYLGSSPFQSIMLILLIFWVVLVLPILPASYRFISSNDFENLETAKTLLGDFNLLFIGRDQFPILNGLYSTFHVFGRLIYALLLNSSNIFFRQAFSICTYAFSLLFFDLCIHGNPNHSTPGLFFLLISAQKRYSLEWRNIQLFRLPQPIIQGPEWVPRTIVRVAVGIVILFCLYPIDQLFFPPNDFPFLFLVLYFFAYFVSRTTKPEQWGIKPQVHQD